MSELNYPTVQIDAKKKVFVSFYKNKKRYRLYTSKRIGGNFNPNSFPEHKRFEMGNVLVYASTELRCLQVEVLVSLLPVLPTYA